MNNNNDTNNNDRQYVYFKISIAGTIQPQLVVIELDVRSYPKTCQSFISLCTSSQTTTRTNPQPTYRGCEFHRIVPNSCVQTGDFERFDGSGGYSPIYGRHFDDEWTTHQPPQQPQHRSSSSSSSTRTTMMMQHQHNDEGIVSMANNGTKNTNGSQWFITLRPVPHLNGQHVPFGKVIGRSMETIHAMVAVDRDRNDRPVPLQRILIVDCGLGMGETTTTTAAASPVLSSVTTKKMRHREHDEEESSTRISRERDRTNQQRRRRPGDDDDDDDDSVERSDSSSSYSSTSSSESSSARRRRRKRRRKEEKRVKRKKKKEKKKKKKDHKRRKREET